MAFRDLLRKELIRTGSKASSKKEVLKEISELVAKEPEGKKIGADTIYKSLRDREKDGSTGFEQGVALPHCSFEELQEFLVGAITVPKGVEFDSVDGKPAKLIFFIVGPQAQRNRHVKLLAALSKAVREPGDIDELLGADSPEAFYRTLSKRVSFEEEEEKSGPVSLLEVYVQELDFFDDILQLIASEVEGSVAVLEMQSAGSYLHRFPLFSTFWTETDTQSVRLIHAVVQRTRVNDLIRRIHMIDDRISSETGVLILVQEINYATGALDF